MRSVAPVRGRLPSRTVALVMGVLFARGHDDRAVAKESLQVHLRPYLDNDGAAAIARQVSWLNDNDTLAVSERLRDVDVPARIVWGAADQFQKLPYGHRLAWDLKAPLDPIEGGKHFVPEDHPDRVAAAIHAVVQEA